MIHVGMPHTFTFLLSVCGVIILVAKKKISMVGLTPHSTHSLSPSCAILADTFIFSRDFQTTLALCGLEAGNLSQTRTQTPMTGSGITQGIQSSGHYGEMDSQVVTTQRITHSSTQSEMVLMISEGQAPDIFYVRPPAVT